MARDLSCPSGLTAYKTKREAEQAALRIDPDGGIDTKRCDRCRWYHVKVKGRRRQERAAKRKGKR